MKKLILALAALAALATTSPAQQPDNRTGYFAIRYDVDSASKTYCVLNGSNGQPFGSPVRVSTRVETVGSSTTITAVTALSEPFDDVSVGDVLVFSVNGTPTMRTVVTNADADTVTVDEAIDLSAGAGFTFSYWQPACGTAATSGWITVRGWPNVQMTVAYLQGDLDTLDVVFECRDQTPDHNIVQVYPGASSTCGFGALATNVCTFTTAGTLPAASLTVSLTSNQYEACRVGLKYGSADASDAGANIERVDASVSVWR